jgi:hypothetical protein
MKKINLLLVGVLAGTLAFAGERDESPKSAAGIAVLKKGETSYKLIYKSELASNVSVSIYNSNHERVFSETIRNSDGFMRPYNFSSLGEGEYTIKVDNGSNWMTRKIRYTGGRVELLAHLIHMKNGKYLLTVPNQKGEKLTVRIINEQGEIINRYTSDVDGDFAQVFDVSHVKEPVVFEVTNQLGESIILKKNI